MGVAKEAPWPHGRAMNTLTDVIVIGGPTASGKSGLALAIAEAGKTPYAPAGP